MKMLKDLTKWEYDVDLEKTIKKYLMHRKTSGFRLDQLDWMEQLLDSAYDRNRDSDRGLPNIIDKINQRIRLLRKPFNKDSYLNSDFSVFSSICLQRFECIPGSSSEGLFHNNQPIDN